MHPLLRLSRKNKFDNYFISFSCGGLRESLNAALVRHHIDT